MEHSVCFIGHRRTPNTPELRERLTHILMELITDGTVIFIFGDHSSFNRLCHETVTQLKEKYPQIRRIHFRKDYENADEFTYQFLTEGYEESVCPGGIGRAGRAAYVERNQAMIRESEVCVFYYDENFKPSTSKKSPFRVSNSGTAVAYEYALQQKGAVAFRCRIVVLRPVRRTMVRRGAKTAIEKAI